MNFQRRPEGVPFLQWLDRLARLHETTEYTLFSLVSFTRDISTASGNQAVTGFNFMPKAAIIFAGFSTAVGAWSVGLDTVSAHYVLYYNHLVTASTVIVNTSNSILIQGAAGNNYAGVVGSFDVDGLTIAWTKTGAPTGTITGGILGLR